MKRLSKVMAVAVALSVLVSACATQTPAGSSEATRPSDTVASTESAVTQTESEAMQTESEGMQTESMQTTAVATDATEEGTADESTTTGPLNVIASFHAIGEMTRAVGGDHVEVRTIVPSGSGAHGFEPKAQDLLALEEGDLFIYNGQGMEAWVDHALEVTDNANLVVVDTSQGVDLIAVDDDDHHDHDHDHDHDDADHDHDDDHEHDDDVDHDHDHDHDVDHDHDHDHDHDDDVDHDHDHDDDHDHDGHDHVHGPNDPHIWLGLTSAMKQVENIRDALSEADPQNQADYEANAKAFNDELQALLDDARTKLQGVDDDHRDFVTGHAAFAYLSRDLDLDMSSVQGIFAEGEPSAKQLAELIDEVREEGVKVVFSEHLASPQVSETLANEVGASVERIYTMESEEDNLTFLERMEHNVTSVVNSLLP